MQERVAVIAVEGQEPIALYGVEPLNFTTQLNRSAVPARLSLMGRHSTIPCLLCEKLNSPGSRCNSPCCVFVAYSRVQVGNFPTSWKNSKRLERRTAMFRTDLFAGKRFLISGGGTGLGRIMMERFVELGADCVICGRRGSVLEKTAREVMAKHPGRRVDTFAVDIRVATAVEEMIDRIWAGGPLDGLVNNAAGNFISQTKDLSARAFDAIANIVLHGTFYMTNACGKRWIAEQRKASVISILTTWVWTGSPFVVPSAMSKAGVAVMTQSLEIG